MLCLCSSRDLVGLGLRLCYIRPPPGVGLQVLSLDPYLRTRRPVHGSLSQVPFKCEPSCARSRCKNG